MAGGGGFWSFGKSRKASNSKPVHTSQVRSTPSYDPYSEEVQDPIVSLNNYNTWELIGKLRDLNNGYKYKYAEYNFMSEDVIIQSALEMYADDGTQVDTKTQKIVCIESTDRQLSKDLNDFLTSQNVDNRVWNWGYSVAQSGDCFLKIHVDTDDYGEYKFSIDDNTDPALIMDLFERGERVGYAEEDDSEYRYLKHRQNPQSLDLLLWPVDKFVHFMIRKTSKYDTLELPIMDETDENGDPLIREFTVVRGVSMIEGVRSIFRILQLLEDSLLAARVAKAQYIRVFNIEVGDSTPKQTTATVNTVKNLFDSKATFDVTTGRYVSNKEIRPIGDPIFNPVRNGKGAINHDEIGGMFEVQNIADIEYFKNKLFSGLKIPKALLGFEEALPGGLGDNTLTRLDIRYSRSVKRVQNALVEGIKELCNIWLRLMGREESVDNFKVVLQAPSTAEELGRLTEFDMKMGTINNLTNTLQSSYGEYINIPKVFLILMNEYLNYPELKDKLVPELEAAIEKYEKHLEQEEEKRMIELETMRKAAAQSDDFLEIDDSTRDASTGTSPSHKTRAPRELRPIKADNKDSTGGGTSRASSSTTITGGPI